MLTPDESGCILDTRVPGPNGYIPTRKGYAHRLAWAAANGPVPDGMCVLHSCDVRACINPKHLFLGTNKDNTQDMVTKGRHAGQRKTQCKWGHEFSVENTLIDSRGRRQCRVCERRRHRDKPSANR